MAILSKENLAGYLLYDYNEKYQRKISPIKFQKGLFFLYAFWAQFANRLNTNGEGVSEVVADDVELELFDAKFEAWKYGPVDRELYQKYNYDTIDYVTPVELFKSEQDTVVTYINDMLSQLYEINDFSLVDLSHEDKVWVKTYEENPCGDGEMPSGEIISEYILRET